MSEGYAAVNGARLWCEVAGAGPPLVMLHGHLIDSGQWDTQMVPFAREFQVVRCTLAQPAVTDAAPLRPGPACPRAA